MIEIYGRLAGKKMRFEFEDSLSCYVALERLGDWIDVVERKECPEDCNRCIWAKLEEAVAKGSEIER